MTLPVLTPAANRRAEMILENIPHVRWIATRIHQRLPSTVVLEDLISIGVIGLIEALDRFDPTLNVQFRTFAEHRIRGAILDSVCELDGIPAHKRAKAKRFKRAVSIVEQRVGRTPSSDEVAAELNITIDEYHAWTNDIRGLTFGSLTAPHVTENSELSLADTLADRDCVQPEDLIEKAELGELVEAGLRLLPVLERKVINLYFKDGLCLRDIAAMLSMHITRVSQLKTRATQRLRRFVEARWCVRNGGAVA